MNIDNYIQQWAQLIRESSDEYNPSELLYEMAQGGDSPSKAENERLNYVIDQFANRILSNAEIVRHRITDLTKLKSEFAICNVKDEHKPYDIIVQWNEDGALKTSTIEDKSTEQSTVFTKTLEIVLKRKQGKVTGISFQAINQATYQSSQDVQMWNVMFSKVSSSIKRQINRSLREIIDEYNSKNIAIIKQEIRFGNDTQSVFDKATMDKIIKRRQNSLTLPFDFSIDMICDHFQETDYLHIGSYFYKFKDGNPLKLRKDNGEPLAKVEDIFANAKAVFQIVPKKKQYSVILHVYNLVRKVDELASIVRDENIGSEKSNSSVSESDDYVSSNTMTLDDLMKQNPTDK